ncbi:MAG: apolipoprotein N-acyltransferase, partial [Gracilimonas sp.]|nr:apolipoprotein N-acyltransferase [Gracilimonas sp.]
YHSYAGFLVWNLICTYWLMMASVPAGVAAILANSVLMTIPLCLAKYFSDKINAPFLLALLQSSAWVGYEFLHHLWDLSWTWLALGNAWANWIGIIQYISVTGFLGISFWVVFTSALTYQLLLNKNKRVAISTVAVFLAFPFWSFLLFQNSETPPPSQNAVEVAIIQPNHDSYQRYSGMSGLNEVTDSLFSLTKRTITQNTELIIWPENAIDGAIFSTSRTARRLADSALTWKTHFITGTGLYKTYDKQTDRLYRGIYPYEPYAGLPYNYFNATLFVKANGAISDYEKANLVPIVERVPFVNTFARLDIFNWVDWGSIAGFGKGTSPDMISTSTFKSPGLICYDSVYPSWIREFVLEGASFLTIITNDGWWGNTSGHLQHFAYARLRAIEFDRWIARSANNGISGIISPNGTIIQQTDYWVRTGITGQVYNKDSMTFYTRFGNWLPVTCLILVFSFLGFFRFRKK